ncbi:MAG: sugar-binding transcriptional regulator [Aeromicrobium sp.]
MAFPVEGLSVLSHRVDDDAPVPARPVGAATNAHVEFELLARVASQYYLNDRTQADIAEEFGLSRQKVQRMIHRAREQGIVEIHVHSVPVLHIELENKLRTTFGLHDAQVAAAHPDEAMCRRQVARAGADYLERRMVDGSVVAVGLGRNTSQVADLFSPSRPLNATFVSAMGGSPGFAAVNPNETCAKFAARSGGVAQALYAPAFVEDSSLRDSLLSQQAISQTLSLARQATRAIIGIGTPADDSILVHAGCLSREQARMLRSAGAVGEIIGNYCDVEGRPIDSTERDRRIGLTIDDLRSIPLVIAVAAEQGKAAAILGALRSGAVHVLITECRNAFEVLRLAGVTDLEEEASLLGGRHDCWS